MHLTHSISTTNRLGTNTKWELYQDLASAPAEVEYLPVVNNSERISYSFDSDGCSPMNASYRLEVVNNRPTDLYDLFNGADPRSILLEITVGTSSIFKGFLDPKYIDQYYDAQGEKDIIVADFFNGLSSIKNVPITIETLEELTGLASVDHDSMIPYDRFFQGMAKSVELRGTKITYHWPWVSTTWREQEIGALEKHTMFNDMFFRFSMYRDYDTVEDEFTGIGRTYGQIMVDMCRTFAVRMGYSFLRNSWVISEIIAGHDGNPTAAEIESPTPGTIAFSPRGGITQVTITRQALAEESIIQPPRARIFTAGRFASVSHEMEVFRSSLYPSLGVSKAVTLDNELFPGSYLLRGYQYGTIPFAADSDPSLIPEPGKVQVIYEEYNAGISLTRLGFVENDATEAEIGFAVPLHVLLCYIWAGWRYFERDRFKGTVLGLYDPMIPVVFNAKNYMITKAEIDPIKVITDLDMIEVDWADPLI